MKEFTERELKYILENADQEAATLMLQAGRYPELPVAQLVQHIQARQKAQNKLPTWYQQPQIRYPVMLSVEQSSSEITAAFKAGLVEGNLLLDLTGGFGIDSFFFSKKIKEVIYVEQNPELTNIAAYNANLLGITNIQFINQNATDFLSHFAGVADYIYLDPARRDTTNRKVHLLADCEPDVLQLLPTLLNKGKSILLKSSPMLDINLAIQQLHHVHQIYVVALENECKEVLYSLTEAQNQNPSIITVNLTSKEDQYFAFDYAAEETALVQYSLPLTYIYEPNTAILKAGGFKSLAEKYTLYKLHRNSHLYTSEELVPDFPGRIFCLNKVSRYNRKELLALLPEKKANITVRNFPDTVAQIRTKTRIKEGGNLYLLATTDINQKPIILLCEKAELQSVNSYQ